MGLNLLETFAVNFLS